MKKEKKYILGKKVYLLGKERETGNFVYLTSATWDCDWYWGFGYIETYSKNDIDEHRHFYDLFLKNNLYYSFKDFFSETPLNDNEIYELLGYMKEFYTMSKYAELLRFGNYITSRAISIKEEKNEEKNLKEYNRINKILMPELFNKIYKLLGEE